MFKPNGPRQALFAAAAALALCASAPVRAGVSTVDFESAEARLYLDQESIVDQGFRFTVLGDFAAVDTAASCFVAVCPSGNDSQFYQGFNDSRVSLARSDGQAFQLLAFDAGFIAPLPLEPMTDVGALQMHAVAADGHAIDRVFLFDLSGEDGAVPFSHYGSLQQPLGNLGWLRSVEFYACTWDVDNTCSNPNQNLGQFALDNVVLQPVPEPSTLALAALGLGALVWRNRRRAA
jgi:hypothetical protein